MSGAPGGGTPFVSAGECHDGSTAVSVHGEIDMATVPEPDDALQRAQGVAPRVVVDLRDVPFTDGSGVRVLLPRTSGRRPRAGGSRS